MDLTRVLSAIAAPFRSLDFRDFAVLRLWAGIALVGWASMLPVARSGFLVAGVLVILNSKPLINWIR